MKLSDQEIELLEDYWHGKLSAEAAGKLEQRLRDDPDFNKAAGQWRRIARALGPSPEDLAIREQIRKKLQKTMSTKRSLPWKLIGGGLLLLAAVLFWWLRRETGYQPNESRDEAVYPIAQRYFRAERIRSGTLGTNVDKPEEAAIKRAYTEGRYREAAEAWNKELQTKGDNRNIFFLAEAWFMAGYPAEAVPLYEKVLAMPGGSDSDVGKYHLALSYAAIGKKEEAKSMLEAIKNSESSYKDFAGAILSELK
ncbi:MAG: hypothetical protein JNJ57_20650 [Saprospiraceae bacterium]|nr:hypothetical protein [Saprospiraceae bacterium]